MPEPAADRRAGYADVLAAPEHQIAEVIDGELHLQPRPSTRYARACSVLGSRIGGPFDHGPEGPGGWLILFEPELHLGDEPDIDIVVPDLSGWRRERMPELPDAAFLRLAPDWVCEVLSPSTRGHDRLRKLPLFCRERVGHVWLLSPEDETLEVLRFDAGSYRLAGVHGRDEVVCVEPFEAIELDLGVLWSR